jgi:aerobic-type carbon monoxide dehydrogenase small subunit (CoxS/CutS family)
MSEPDDAMIPFHLNGREVSIASQSRGHLADLLRDHFRLTGTHVGCEHGVCGACNVKVDGHVVRGCLTLAAQLEGCDVLTIEGLADSGTIADLQEAFVARNALQCGYCTPGMLMTAEELLRHNPAPSRKEIREAISGNYCRCTGYQAIVDAITSVAEHRALQVQDDRR